MNMNTTDLNQEELLETWPRRGGAADDHHSEIERAVRRDTLLEHWPRRESSVISFDSDEDDEVASGSDKRLHRKLRTVQFSESSQLYVYERESMYLLKSLAYTKEDRNDFGKDALLEGFRIKNLIAAAPHDSVTDSIKYLRHQGVISKEELIGIDHFVLGSNVKRTRERHSAAVLRRQEEQQGQQLDDPALKLGEFARSSSLRSSKRARIRAAMAA